MLQQTRPTILYDNLVKLTNSTLSFFEITAHPLANALDWADYTRFLVGPAGISYITSVIDSSALFDCFYVFYEIPAFSNGTNYKVILKKKDGGLYSTVATINIPAWEGKVPDTTMQLIKLPVPVTSGDGEIRVEFSIPASPNNNLYIKQIVVGKCFQPELGQWSGVAPSDLQQQFTAYNNISINGSILGRTVTRIEKQGAISLSLCSQEWIRDVWYPFLQHAIRKAFIYSWNHEKYPEAVAFASATSTPSPTNSSPPGKMDASLPMKLITN